jgi:hypothetical protein
MRWPDLPREKGLIAFPWEIGNADFSKRADHHCNRDPPD